MMRRDACLEQLRGLRDEQTVVVTTMSAVVPWSRLSQSPLDFPSAGSAMGHAADFALGVALAQPHRPVWAINGDGSMLMCLGTLVTICQTPAPNLVLFVLENRTYEVTGNQPIPGAGRVSFAEMARAAGFVQVDEFFRTEEMAARLPRLLARPGPTFVTLHIEPGHEPPPKVVGSLQAPAHELREVLLGESGFPAP
jgi:thiamine pyrophosphate-dependent acetolactate synthase large subunit-like protein